MKRTFQTPTIGISCNYCCNTQLFSNSVTWAYRCHSCIRSFINRLDRIARHLGCTLLTAWRANPRRFTYLKCALSAYRVRSRGACHHQYLRHSSCAFYFNLLLCVQLSGKLKIVICDHDARDSIVVCAVCARYEMRSVSFDADARASLSLSKLP